MLQFQLLHNQKPPVSTSLTWAASFQAFFFPIPLLHRHNILKLRVFNTPFRPLSQ
jgi:hypothetical protein